MKIFSYLLFFFIGVPIIELVILFSLSGFIGAIETFLVIVITGFIGAHLARTQGLRTLTKIKTSLHEGKMPATEMVDGLILLVAAVVLITPGFLTDIIGLLLLLPMIRKLVRAWLYQRFKVWIQSGRMQMSGNVRFSVNYGGNLRSSSRPHEMNGDDDPAIDVSAADVTTDQDHLLDR